MADIARINRFLQQQLSRKKMREVSAVEAARWLDQAGILKDSLSRPGKPLRELLRARVIDGQRQDGVYWYIEGQSSDETEPDAKQIIGHQARKPHTRRVADESDKAVPRRPDSGLERLRLRYRPDTIRVLLIGESPPNATFFYNADSTLFTQTNYAFQDVYGQSIGTGATFLQFFQSAGFFLEDLCFAPGKPTADQLKLAVPSLASRIKEAGPQAIIVVILGIRQDVQRAIALADASHIPTYFLPFPSRQYPKHQERYRSELAEALRQLIQKSVVRADYPARR